MNEELEIFNKKKEKGNLFNNILLISTIIFTTLNFCFTGTHIFQICLGISFVLLILNLINVAVIYHKLEKLKQKEIE